jgi:purine-binding chemotaxis protein CheW
MALGKNLKKAQLIPDVPADTKVLAPKSIKKKTRPSGTRTEASPKSAISTKAFDIANVISEVVFQRRKAMQEAYDKEIQSLQGQQVHLIVMTIGTEAFAIEISKVREVVVRPTINELPRMPKYICGLAEIRGSVTVVMDLSVKLDIHEEGEKGYVMVVENDDLDVGLLLQNVPVTLKVMGEEIYSSSGLVADTALQETFIKGIVHTKDKLVYWVDVDGLVESERAVVLKAEESDSQKSTSWQS